MLRGRAGGRHARRRAQPTHHGTTHSSPSSAPPAPPSASTAHRAADTLTQQPCGKALEAGLNGAAAGERLLRRAAAGSTGEPAGGATGGTAEAAARGRRPGGDMWQRSKQRRTRTRTTTGGRNTKHSGRTPRTGGAETARARTARTRLNAEPRHRLPPVSSCAHNKPHLGPLGHRQ